MLGAGQQDRWDDEHDDAINSPPRRNNLLGKLMMEQSVTQETRKLADDRVDLHDRLAVAQMSQMETD